MRGPCLRLSRSPREATPDPRATLPHHPARSGHPQTLLYCLSRPVFTSGTTRYVCFETRRSFASWLPSQDRSSVRGISAMFAAPRTAPGSGSAGCRQLCLAGRDVTATSVRAGTVRVCARHRVRASVPCLTRSRCPTNTDWIKARGRGGLLGNGPLQRERGTGLRGEGVRVGRAPPGRASARAALARMVWSPRPLSPGLRPVFLEAFRRKGGSWEHTVPPLRSFP